MECTSDLGRTHGRLAALGRHQPGGVEHTEAKREHKYALAADAIEHVRRMVAEWPPLTREQRERLATLFNRPDGC